MSIYEPQGKAREYSPLALNYFKGCDHGCKYCYVPPMMSRFSSNYDHDTVKSEIDYDKIRRSAKKMQGCGKQILLSFTSDPYNCAENGETAKVISILNEYGHKVAVLTKNPGKAMKDIELFKSMGNRFKIGTTLVFSNEQDSLEWEKGAPNANSRLKALEEFSAFGIKTYVSFEPVIDPEQTLLMLEIVSGFVDHVKIGKLNNYKGLDKKIDWTKFLYDSVRICREKNVRFYIKKDLAKFNTGLFLSGNETDDSYLCL